MHNVNIKHILPSVALSWCLIEVASVHDTSIIDHNCDVNPAQFFLDIPVECHYLTLSLTAHTILEISLYNHGLNLWVNLFALAFNSL